MACWTLLLHWQGGAVSQVQTYRSRHMKERILALWRTGATAADIATRLNAEGSQTMLKRPWSQINVGQVLQKYKGTTAAWQVTQQRVQDLQQQGLRAGLIARQLNARRHHGPNGRPVDAWQGGD